MHNDVEEVISLMNFVAGMASIVPSQTAKEKLRKVEHWLYKLSHNMCGDGYIGCPGGQHCRADHK